MTDDTRDEIRQVLRDHARLPVDVDALGDGDDLFAAGMSSHASVNLMLALEDAFDVEFPDEMLTRRRVRERVRDRRRRQQLRAGVT